MSTYQMVIRSTGAAFQSVTVLGLYARFLDWWVSLYAKAPRNLRPLI